MRLGLVGPLPPPNGGMAMQTLQLARLLTEEGVAVEMVQTNAPYWPAVVGKVRGLRALFRILPYLWRVWRMAGRNDVIHLMANSGWSWQLFAAPVIWIGWLRKKPVLVNYRGGEAREYLAASARWVKPSLTRAAQLVVPSGFLRQVFSEFGVAAAVIPNIIDLELFSPAPKPPTQTSFTLAITRNLEPIYGLDTALRALALAREEVPSLQLRIAGSGPQGAELERLVETLGLGDAVVFMGRLERQQVVELYHSAHAMLNPSRVDNMPNSVLEALACGLPVISTNVGGVPYIVEDGQTALLVPRDDAPAMAQAMIRLYNDSSLRNQLREQGRRAVAQYAWDEVRPLWLAQYNKHTVTA
ncbi:N-acetyl-alpha-D-glucosaminyl L-malate synthase [Halioglobus japonicus]|nr:N-acetyl-alpha-D-glucosaminyl L-malate synthase [Halioglobus japonicus]